MLLLTLLAPFVVLATRVVGISTANVNISNPVSVPINKRINTAGGFNISKNDIDRWSFLLKSGLQPDVLLNDVGISYTVTIGVGTPPQYFDLIVDTGSSNTWIGANNTYIPTKSSIKTPDSFNISYGGGSVNGIEYMDTVTIAPGVVIHQQSIGVALNTTGFYYSDGIFGIGPTDLTLNTIFPDNSSTISTVTDNLVQQGIIKQNVVGVYFEPSNSTVGMGSNSTLGIVNGELTFSGTNPTKYIGDITYHNLTKTAPINEYFGLDASFLYGNEDILSTSSGIIDTGTNLVGLATSAYDRYANATGAVYDNATQLLRITPDQYENLQSLYFIVDNISYELNRNAQILPRTFNTFFGGDLDHLYLVVFDLGPLTGTINFVCGMTFLQRYYSVYDQDCPSVGFASTRFTHATDIN